MKSLNSKKILIWISRHILPCLIILAVAFLMVLPQIQTHAYYAGIDSWFHMNQYYDTATQIKTGHWSYFLMLFGFHGVGRIINAIYGAGFMYLNGLLLLITKTWAHFEIIQDLIVLSITGISFFVLCSKNYINRALGTVLSILYMFTMPVLSFLSDQEYVGIGAMLFPLIMIQATQMARHHKIHPIALAITISIVIETHILTALVGVICLVPFFIFAWYYTDHVKQLWKNLGYAVLLTLVLTGNIWGSLLNILPQKLIPPVPQSYPTVFGSLAMTKPFKFQILSYSSSMLLIILAVSGIICLGAWTMTSGIMHMTYLLGLFAFWFSSQYFPWHWFFSIYPQYVYQIQLPKRFVDVAFCCLLLSFGMLFSRANSRVMATSNRKVSASIIGICTVLLAGLAIYDYPDECNQMDQATHIYRSHAVVGFNAFHAYHLSHHKQVALRASYHSRNLGKSINLLQQDTPDYLPTHKSIHNYPEYRHDAPYSGIQKQLYDPDKLFRFESHQVKHGALTLKWNQKRSKSYALIPVVKYADTQITLNGKHLKHPATSRIGAIMHLSIPAGKDTLTLKYHAPLILKCLVGLSVISWFTIVILELMRRIQIHKKSPAPCDRR